MHSDLIRSHPIYLIYSLVVAQYLILVDYFHCISEDISMHSLREFFGTKRNLISLTVLAFIALTLPLALYLVKQQQTFRSNASGELIQLAEGNCIISVLGVKTAICNTIPLKLTNPFNFSSSQPSSSVSASVTVSPTPSDEAIVSPSPTQVASAANCATSASTGAELLAAVGCYKHAAGTNRKITLSAGTFEVGEKIAVPSNLTIAGAGMTATIIKKSAAFDSDDALMANDSSAGQENIVLKDFTLQGDGVRSGNSCCYGLKLQNITKAFVVNVAVNNWGIDGIFVGQRPNKPGAKQVRITGCQVNNNGRNGISFVDVTESVIDHCQISGNSSNEMVAAIDLEPDNGNSVSDNHIFENSITNNKNNGIQLMENPNDPGGAVFNNYICNNTYGGNGGTDFADSGASTKTSGCSAGTLSVPTAFVNNDQNILVENNSKEHSEFSSHIMAQLEVFKNAVAYIFTPKAVSAVAVGGFSSVKTNGCGEVISTPAIGSVEGDLIYVAPVKTESGWETRKKDGTVLSQSQILAQLKTDARVATPEGTIGSTFINCDVFINYSQETDCDIDAPLKGREGVNGGKLSSGEQVTLHVRTDTSPQSPGCRIQMQTQSTGTSLPATPSGLSYRLAESQAGLAQAQWVAFSGSTIVANFTASPIPGAKQIWVEYRNNSGQTLTDHISFTMLAPTPVVSNINCSLDIINKNVKVTVTGTNLGADKGTITANAGPVEISSWSDTAVTGLIKGSGETGAKYAIGFKRADTMAAPAQTCEVNVSSLSVGAKVFCRESSATDVSSVKVAFFSPEAPEKKIEETAIIDKDGILQGLKTKLSAGVPYVISLKAPYSVRRNASFTGQEGTTIINGPGGKPFILPIGDISPTAGDGQINALDRAELVKQWRILGSSASAVLTADFNHDKKVNSVDWACMKYDFNAKDDAPDSVGSGSTGGNGPGQIQQGQNSAIFTTP